METIKIIWGLIAFLIGPYEYELTINKKHVARITNNSFLIGPNILSGKEYRVELERLFDSKKLIDKNILLNPGNTANISYHENIIYSADFNGRLIYQHNNTNRTSTVTYY
ncbi:MAG: hypothetical protein ABSG94_12620 [Brevinematales bacterium]|jgi:hypothetical protein